VIRHLETLDDCSEYFLALHSKSISEKQTKPSYWNFGDPKKKLIGIHDTLRRQLIDNAVPLIVQLREQHKPSEQLEIAVLYEAAKIGQLKAIRNLIEAKVDINTRLSYTGETALVVAATGRHLGVIMVLLEAGAIVADDDEGGIALQRASGNGHLDVVTALLDFGAQVNNLRVNDFDDGETALLLASANGHIEKVDFLFCWRGIVSANLRSMGT
jgi:ankyrin repeat protein